MRDEYQEHWLREHRWKVVGTTAAVFGFITMGVVRWAKDKEKEDAIERVARFEEELGTRLPPPPPVMPEDPPPPPPAPPIRFEVVAGTQAGELADGRATMNAEGTEVAVRELSGAEFAGGGLSFRHAGEVSVTRERDGSVVAAVDGGSVVLVPLAVGAEVAPGFPGTGADDSQPGPARRQIAGGEREGTLHHRSSGAIVETFAIELDKRRLGIILYRDGADRPIAALEEVLASLAPSAATRGPGFELLLGAKPKREVALDAPVPLGKGRKQRVVVRRRPTIRRTVGGLTFEHPWGLAVSPGASEVTSVAVLRGRQIAIRLVLLPMAMGVGAARSSLLGSAEVREDAPVESSFDGDEVRGKRYAVSSDIGEVKAELFVLRRGGKHIGAAVIYVEAEQGEALALADPVLGSVH